MSTLVSLYVVPSATSASFTWAIDYSSIPESSVVSGILQVISNGSTRQVRLTKTDLVGTCEDPCVPALVVTGLMQGVTYQAILIVNAISGSSIVANQSNYVAFVCAGAPSAPTINSATYNPATVTPPGPSSITVNFVLGANNGSLITGVTFYIVDVNDLNTDDYYYPIVAASLPAPNPNGSYTITIPNTYFSEDALNSIFMTSTNSAGISDNSNSVYVWCSVLPPSPILTSALSGQDSVIPLTWTQLLNPNQTIASFNIGLVGTLNGGSPTTSTSSAILITDPLLVISGNSYSYPLSSSNFSTPNVISNGTVYSSFTIHTNILGGGGADSLDSPLTAVPVPNPLVLSTGGSVDLIPIINNRYNVVVTTAGISNSGINVFLTAPLYNFVLTTPNGTYTAQNNNEIATFTNVLLNAGQTASCAITGYLSLTHYQLNGWQNPAPAVNPLVSNTVTLSNYIPIAPGSPTINEVIPFASSVSSSANFYVSWSAPVYTGTSNILGYIVQYALHANTFNTYTSPFTPPATGTDVYIPVASSEPDLNYTFTNLNALTEYFFQVIAVNADDYVSAPSDYVSSQWNLNFSQPVLPQNSVTLVNGSQGNLNLQFVIDVSSSMVPADWTARLVNWYVVNPQGSQTPTTSIVWNGLTNESFTINTTIQSDAGGGEYIIRAYISGLTTLQTPISGPPGSATAKSFSTPVVTSYSIIPGIAGTSTVTATVASNGCTLVNSAFIYMAPSTELSLGNSPCQFSNRNSNPATATNINFSSATGDCTITWRPNYLVDPTANPELLILVNYQEGTAFLQVPV